MARQLDIVNTTSRHAVNKKLIRAMEYVSQFNVKAVHKPGKDHLVPDALSRLKVSEPTHREDAPGQLDNMPDDRPEHWQRLQSAQWTQHNPAIAPIPQNTVPSAERPVASLLSIAPEYKRQTQDGYETDPPWRYVTTVLQGNKELEVENQAKLPFFWEDGLL
ncbi:hypothetical protein E4U32_001733 [Claviceps aff. humidiphila group G2b]|nr:hypothetical protein E4U32_001733 [Claviceps aff. humidiphila group G2b]